MILAEAGYNHEKHQARIEAIPKHLPVGKIIELVTQIYKDLYDVTPEGINYGMCENFAEDVRALCPGAETWWLDELTPDPNVNAHKVVLFQGKYYDSTHPNGKEDWRDLDWRPGNRQAVSP